MIISYNFITFVTVVVEPAVGQLSAKKSTRSKGKNIKQLLQAQKPFGKK